MNSEAGMTSSVSSRAGAELEYIRSQFIIEAFSGFFYITTMVIPIALFRWASEGFDRGIAIQFSSIVLLFVIWSYRYQIKVHILSALLLLILGFAASVIVLLQGFHTVGFLFLLFFTFTAAISFAWRGMAAGAVLVIGLLGTAAFLHLQGIVVTDANERDQTTSLSAWLIQAWSLIILIAWLTIPTMRLLGRVQSLAQEKEKQSELAEAASHAKSAFLANMSHEIRTPMNGVLGMADILGRTSLSTEQQRMVNTIQGSSDALLKIIDDILDISKIEAGKIVLEKVAVDPLKLAEGAVTVLRPFAKQSNVRLLLVPDPDLPLVHTDPVRLRQVLLNLMNNAIKFSRGASPEEPGWVKLRIVRSSGSRFQFIVEDSGIGIEQDKIDSLFQPFKQAEESTTREFGGTGLGLAIVKNLVDILDGQISVKSTLGEGSAFTVELPFDVIGKPGQTYDLSGLNIHAFLDDQIVESAFQGYLAFEGTVLHFYRDEKTLREAIASTSDGAFVILAQQSMHDMRRIKTELSNVNSALSFVMLVYDLDALADCAEPDCVRVLRGPLVPSELQHALMSMKNKMQPDTESPRAEEKEGMDEDIIEILVVEDNLINQQVIAKQLTLLGYNVELASDGQEGLDKWTAGDFSLVLSDCHMPVMDGYEMAQAIRAAEEVRNKKRTPIIAVTANALKGEAEKCYAAGMVGYLSKPVGLEDIR